MRRPMTLALVVAGVLLMAPRPAAAQGFWRYFERLSGPEVSGPGFDVVLFCHGVEQGRQESSAFVSPLCSRARRDRIWISAGAQSYLLAGDNNMTQDPDDRVDVIGVVPFVDVNFPAGFAVGAGFGVRHYSGGSESFNKPVFEAALKLRPGALIARARGVSRDRPSFALDFFEIRPGLVYQGAFEPGQFGRDSEGLESDWSFVLFVAFNPLQ